MPAEIELPRYQRTPEYVDIHNPNLTIQALQIATVDDDKTVHFTDARYSPIRATDEWFERYHGRDDDWGYYVVDDSQVSLSATELFERAYALV